MNVSGIWKGFSNGKVGHFKFTSVKVIGDQEANALKKLERNSRKACPSTVDELLSRIGLKEYTSVFVLNG